MTRRTIALLALLLVVPLERTSAQQLSSDELDRRAIERRAVEAAIWGMPIVAMTGFTYETEDQLHIDGRAATFYLACGSPSRSVR